MSALIRPLPRPPVYYLAPAGSRLPDNDRSFLRIPPTLTMARPHPMLVACGSALVIDCCSNIIAQRLKAWSDAKPFVFDRVLFFQFAFMVVLTAPVNYHWQHWLERTFPGWTTVKRTRHATNEDGDAAEKAVFLKEDGEDKRMVEEEVLERNWLNIFKKWFTDVCDALAI